METDRLDPSVVLAMRFFSTIFTAFTLCATALAAPFEPEARADTNVFVVVNPKITNPTAKTTWVVGNKYPVEWYDGGHRTERDGTD